MIFQTYIIFSDSIHSLKNQKSTTLGCNDIEIRKSEFVAKTQFLLIILDLIENVIEKRTNSVLDPTELM